MGNSIYCAKFQVFVKTEIVVILGFIGYIVLLASNFRQRAMARFYKNKYAIDFEFVSQGSGSLTITGDGIIKFDKKVQLKSGTYIDCTGGLQIGRYFHTGKGLSIYTSDHIIDSNEAIPYGPTKVVCGVMIKDYVWVGADVTILPGVTIGKGAVIGNSSVVTKDVEAFSIVAGVPAKRIGQRDVVKFEENELANRFF